MVSISAGHFVCSKCNTVQGCKQQFKTTHMWTHLFTTIRLKTTCYSYHWSSKACAWMLLVTILYKLWLQAIAWWARPTAQHHPLKLGFLMLPLTLTVHSPTKSNKGKWTKCAKSDYIIEVGIIWAQNCSPGINPRVACQGWTVHCGVCVCVWVGGL